MMTREDTPAATTATKHREGPSQVRDARPVAVAAEPRGENPLRAQRSGADHLLVCPRVIERSSERVASDHAIRLLLSEPAFRDYAESLLSESKKPRLLRLLLTLDGARTTPALAEITEEPSHQEGAILQSVVYGPGRVERVRGRHRTGHSTSRFRSRNRPGNHRALHPNLGRSRDTRTNHRTYRVARVWR